MLTNQLSVINYQLSIISYQFEEEWAAPRCANRIAEYSIHQGRNKEFRLLNGSCCSLTEPVHRTASS